MNRKFSLIGLMVAVAMLFGMAGGVAAQPSGAYVNTFDLQIPTTEGEYAGVDPSGVTITWWHNHTGRREEAVNAAVAQFSEGNPWGITVEAISKGSYDDIFSAITAGIQTGELPNITVAYGNQAALYQDDNALVDLNVFVNDPVLGIGEDFTTDMFTGFFDSDLSVDHDMARLGFSVYRSMEVLYYNVDALAALGVEPPQTWEQFRDITCRWVAEDPENRDGYQVRTDASFIAAAAFAAGVDVYDAENDVFTYDLPEVAVMPAIMQQMVAEGCARLQSERRGDQNAFTAGRAIFYTGSSSGIPFVADGIRNNPNPFIFDVAPIPGWTDQPTQNIYGASNSVVGLGKSPEEILASWLFLRWYTETEQQVFWAAQSNYFPVRRSAASGLADVFAAELTGRPYESAFNLLGNVKAEPSVPVYQTVRSEASNAFNNILDGAPVVETLAELNDLSNRLLEEARAAR